MSIKHYLKIKNYKIKNWTLFAAVFLILSLPAFKIYAQEPSKVDYNNEVIVDSDLDGLTDKGEQQLYQTDPGNQDTDGDGYLDGAEVLGGTDPLDALDYAGHRVVEAAEKMAAGDPWIWYFSRAAGFIGFIFLWLTIFLGLSIRNPWLKKIVAPVYSFDLHCAVGALAVFWSLAHGTSFLFHDGEMALSVKEIALPFFYSGTLVQARPLALGILAFYFLVIMTVTSYLRARLNYWVWRVLHFLHPIIFLFVVIHGYKIGTDMKNDWVSGAFLLSSYILAILYVSSLIFILRSKLKKPEIDTLIS